MNNVTVSGALEARAERAADAPFFHCGTAMDPWVTPAQLHARSARLAGGLASLGILRGDRVALLMPNRVEMVEALFACANLGAVQVPLNYWIRGEYLRYQLDDCGARVLIADRAGFETAPGTLTPEAVFEFMRDRVAYFAIPRFVHVHESLPVNAMQRVMKDRLRAEGVPEGCWDLEELGLVVPRDERRGAGKTAPVQHA
jgi:acyl-CoA synthetase (AMP-forming)/AMP-acid ligase II